MFCMPRRRYLFTSLIILPAIFLSNCSDDKVTISSSPATVAQSSSTQSVAQNPSTTIETKAEAQRFLARATFGPKIDEITNLEGQDASQWIKAEFSKPSRLYLSRILSQQTNGTRATIYDLRPMVWQDMISSDDQLRQRMVFALSQIVVVSSKHMTQEGDKFAYYLDQLNKNAFGNYRDLLEDITYSPAMASYLTYYRNKKEDPATGRMPDENYARELLQLFTIGLIELNMDGTPKTANGETIETFTNEDIQGLARVFTGFSQKGSGFWSADADGPYKRLTIYADQHSQSEKSFLGQTIPAGTSGDESVRRALDIIFEHPNVAPFVSRQLIQRFTLSDPPPDYIERVATAFENGTFKTESGDTFGNGQRGDLQATLAAILLDPVVNSDEAASITTPGKVREPVLKFVNLARAFDFSPLNAKIETSLKDTSSPFKALGQHPMSPPSVFNFYRPGFVAPGTESGAQGMTAPEFQIINSGSIVGYLNFNSRYIMDKSYNTEGVANFQPDYSEQLLLADVPESLVEHLDLLLTGETLHESAKQKIVEAVESLPITEGRADEDRLHRVHVAIFLTMSSSAYAIQN